jgi:hypothetical protein
MEPILAMCGIDCSQCGAFLATQANDLDMLEQEASKWMAEYHLEKVTVKDVTCDSCLATSERLGAHCYECDIRLCGLARNINNCAECPDYGCEKLTKFFTFVPDAKNRLETIRLAG